MTRAMAVMHSDSMPCDPTDHDADGSSVDHEACQWRSPKRMRQYQWSKAIGGLLMCGVFAGWLALQWSNPMMRGLAMTLIVITCWVVVSSLLTDVIRSRGQRVAIDKGSLRVTTPAGTTEIGLADITYGTWQEHAQPGLWLYDQQGQVVAHLDERCLADQAEARAFLHWARLRGGLRCDVHWPATP